VSKAASTFLSLSLCFPLSHLTITLTSPLSPPPPLVLPFPFPFTPPLSSQLQQERRRADNDADRRRRSVASLHGDLPQVARDAAIAALRAGTCDVLVATDVAARGLDLPGVELIIHADLPRTADAYAHRAGRAGRPGCAARGVSLMLPSPDPKATAAVAVLEREARVSLRRLTTIGERLKPGRSAEAAAASSAAAAARSSAALAAAATIEEDAAAPGTLPSAGAGVSSTSSTSGDVINDAAANVAATAVGSAAATSGAASATAPPPAAKAAVTFAAVDEDDHAAANAEASSMSARLREEDAECARARQGEQLLITDRFAELSSELSDMQNNKGGGGGGGGGGKKGKGKGRR